MKTEVPVFKRCCFCLPVRYGILTGAYLSLVYNCLLLLQFIIWFIFHRGYQYFEFYKLLLMGFYLFAAIVDISFVVLLIIAAHRKNSRLLWIYYCVQRFTVAAWFVLLIADLVLDFTSWCRYDYYDWRVIIFKSLQEIVNIGLQLYVLAVVRSEVLKLDSQHQVRFSNIAAEAECEYYTIQESQHADKHTDTDGQPNVDNTFYYIDNADYGDVD